MFFPLKFVLGFLFFGQQAENHDNLRVGSRLCEEYMDLVTITIMMLPGVACIYYGQEIGMMNNLVRIDQRKDANNDGNTGAARDGERLPMQWDDTMNAGKVKFMQKYLLPFNFFPAYILTCGYVEFYSKLDNGNFLKIFYNW